MYNLCLYFVFMIGLFMGLLTVSQKTGALTPKGWSTDLLGIGLHFSIDWFSDVDHVIQPFMIFNVTFWALAVFLFLVAGLTNSLPGDREQAPVSASISAKGLGLYWWASILFVKSQVGFAAFVFAFQIFVSFHHWSFDPPAMGVIAGTGLSLIALGIAIVDLRVTYSLTHRHLETRLFSSKAFRLIWFPSRLQIGALKRWRTSSFRKWLSNLA